jgi:hypothetical protein
MKKKVINRRLPILTYFCLGLFFSIIGFNILGFAQAILTAPSPGSYTSSTLVPGSTKIRIADINDMRNLINAKRLAAGLGIYPFTDPVLTPGASLIRARHFTEMQVALKQIYAVVNATPSYSDVWSQYYQSRYATPLSSITPPGDDVANVSAIINHPIQASAVTALRNAIDAVGVCGDTICQNYSGLGPENCSTCPADCQASCSTSLNPVCGVSCGTAGTCNSSSKCQTRTCPAASGCTVDYACLPNLGCTCGNGTCDAVLTGETNANCSVDCPICGNNIIEGSEACDGTNLAGQTCVTKGFSGGTLSCTACAFNTSSCSSTVCGDGTCSAGETAATCLVDCHCGDGACQSSYSEDSFSCPADCGYPNGRCDWYETAKDNPLDCPAGCNTNGYCNLQSETKASCPSDCFDCNNNGVCQTGSGESQALCPADCSCISPFTQINAGHEIWRGTGVCRPGPTAANTPPFGQLSDYYCAPLSGQNLDCGGTCPDGVTCPINSFCAPSNTSSSWCFNGAGWICQGDISRCNCGDGLCSLNEQTNCAADCASDAYGFWNVGSPADTCDGNATASFTCPAGLSKVCIDNNGLNQWRNVTCKP